MDEQKYLDQNRMRDKSEPVIYFQLRIDINFEFHQHLLQAVRRQTLVAVMKLAEKYMTTIMANFEHGCSALMAKQKHCCGRSFTD